MLLTLPLVLRLLCMHMHMHMHEHQSAMGGMLSNQHEEIKVLPHRMTLLYVAVTKLIHPYFGAFIIIIDVDNEVPCIFTLHPARLE